MWAGNNAAFYNKFYNLVYTPDPNSMTTFVLAALLFVVKGAIAEKLFLSAYVLLYISGFVLLLRQLGKGNSYWLLSVFLFVFTYALSKGFYNFSFGIAFWFWMVWAWLRYLQNRKLTTALAVLLFSGLTFFSHLLPFVFGMIACGFLLLSHGMATDTERKLKPAAYIMRNGLILALLTGPYILLTFLFTGREGGLQLHLAPHPYRLLELAEFKYIINITHTERPWAAIAGVILSCLLAVTLIRALRGYTINKYDGFIPALVVIGFVYTFFPEDFLGHAIIISIRSQLFIHLLIVCIVAYRMPKGRWQEIGGVTLFGCFLILSWLRITVRQDADTGLKNQLTATAHIRSGSVLLPLDLAPNGRHANGTLIADRNAIFHHSAQYIGLEKQLIILDNYEANMGYFPIRWKDETNPYTYLSKAQGIEGDPPAASIAGYEKKIGTKIDFVMLWGYPPTKDNDPGFKELYTEINALYHLIYTAQGGQTYLYERNTP